MDCNREAILDGIYRALVEWDRQERNYRDLRMISRGRGPTIKRGTKRAAKAHFLTNAVLESIRTWES